MVLGRRFILIGLWAAGPQCSTEEGKRFRPMGIGRVIWFRI